MLRLTLFAFGCTATLVAAPSITQVVNAAAWLPPGLPNSGIAQGAFFTIKGSGLGPDTLVQATSYPLPTTQGLGGTTVQVTVGGVTENCIMHYASNAQVAGIVPSATPAGTGTITVSYQGSQASAPIVVQSANFGTFTLNQGGSGPAGRGHRCELQRAYHDQCGSPRRHCGSVGHRPGRGHRRRN